MSDDNDCKPIGDVLDGLGVAARLEADELVSGALVLLVIVDGDGDERLTVATSEGLSWLTRAGMIGQAHASECQMAAESS